MSYAFYICPEKNRQLPNGHALTALSSSSTSLMKSESLREPRPKSGGGSHRHTRQASYKGERPDHRFRSPERGSSSELRIQLSARISSGEVHPKLVEEIMDSPRRLVEEVDSEYSQNSSSRDLEIVRADFSQTAPQFQNSKLSEQYEIGQRSAINGTESSTTSVSPVTPKLDGCAVVSQQNLNRQQEKQSDLKTAHSNGKQDVTRAKELESVDSVGSGVCSYKAPTSVTSSPRLAGPVLEQCGRQSTDDGGSVCSSLTSGSSQYEALEKQIQTQVWVCHVCVCVCAHMCAHAWAPVCVCVCVCVRAHTHTCMCECVLSKGRAGGYCLGLIIFVCKCVFVCTCERLCMCTFVNLSHSVCVYDLAWVCVFVYVHV